MTEQTGRIKHPEEIIAGHAELPEESRLRLPRCPVGQKTDSPCWRDAVVRHEGLAMMLCEEHARAYELSEEVNRWNLAESVTGDWLRVSEDWEHEDLERLARNAHEDAKGEAVRAEARAELAWQIAKAPPAAGSLPGSLEKPHLNAEQDQKLVELIQRADSFNDAYAMIEDVPEEGVRDERWRRIILGVLAEAKEAANQEHERYREELGL